MEYLRWLKHLAEYLGGAQDGPPPGVRLGPGSPWWGLWWGVLALLIVLFCGQSSKFIYIDF
jgi:hypothetical protein